jgi:Leucine-rich repeat (LRR) protein
MLKGIDLSGNKLQDLPSFFALFDSLSYLDLSKNKFTIFPLELCSLTNLKQLIFNRNSFEELPDCVRYLTNLELLDLWSTPVHLFSEGFLELKNIRRIDLQGNRYSPSLQTKLKNHFPNAQILMDSPCDCME